MNKRLFNQVNELNPEKSDKLVDFIWFSIKKKKNILKDVMEIAAQMTMPVIGTLLVKENYLIMAFYYDELMLIYNPNTKKSFKEIYSYNQLDEIGFNIKKVKDGLFFHSYFIEWVHNDLKFSCRGATIKKDVTLGKNNNRVGIKIQEILDKLLDAYPPKK